MTDMTRFAPVVTTTRLARNVVARATAYATKPAPAVFVVTPSRPPTGLSFRTLRHIMKSQGIDQISGMGVYVATVLDDFSMEMTGKDVAKLENAAGTIPPGTRIHVTFL